MDQVTYDLMVSLFHLQQSIDKVADFIRKDNRPKRIDSEPTRYSYQERTNFNTASPAPSTSRHSLKNA